MNKSSIIVAALCAIGVVAAGASVARPPSLDMTVATDGKLVHGRALSFDLDGKHAVTYFLGAGDACEVTLVVADVTGGVSGKDSPGTRFSVDVVAGGTMTVDASAKQSAELSCSEDTSSLTLKTYDRVPYKS